MRVWSDANDMAELRGKAGVVLNVTRSSIGSTGYMVRVEGRDVHLASMELEYAYGYGVKRVGARVELSPHLDLWTRGARYGTVKAVRADGNVQVKADKVRKLLLGAPANFRVIDASAEADVS